MILTDDNFATIVKAVEYGRAIYNSLSNYIRFQMTALVAFIASYLGAALFVIAGGVAQAGEPLRARIEEELRVAATVGSEPPPPVVLGQLGDEAGMLGGASLAFSGTTY